MAAEDNNSDPEEIDGEGFLEINLEEDDPDEELLDDDLEELDEVEIDDEAALDEEAEEATPAVVAKKKGKKDADEEEEDEDEELVGDDDVEASLDVILDARIKGRSEDDEEDVEEEEEDDSALGADPDMGIQPKRADERLCSQCFLLVRKGAPMCPVGDDTCPLFT
ncbi:MAG: hypothetical protein ACKPBG_10985 [Actinomycetota bacterium]